MEAWTTVFVTIIALNALVQAGLVFAALFGMRLLNRSLDQLEAHVEREIQPRVEDLTRVAARMVEASEAARTRSIRIDTALAVRLGGMERRLRRTVGRVRRAAEDAVDDVDERPGGWPGLLLSGLFRGLQIWRGSAPEEEDESAEAPLPDDEPVRKT
jgi:hypothetical protein